MASLSNSVLRAAITSRHKLVALELCHLRESEESPPEVASSIRTRVHDQFAQRLQHSIRKLHRGSAPSQHIGEATQVKPQNSSTVILEACNAKSEISLSCAEDGVSNFLHRLNDAFRGGAVTQMLDQDQDRRPLNALEVAKYVCDSVRSDAEQHNALVKQEYSKQVRTKYERAAEFQEIAQTPHILTLVDRGSDFALGAVPGVFVCRLVRNIAFIQRLTIGVSCNSSSSKGTDDAVYDLVNAEQHLHPLELCEWGDRY